jgi:hypothetical protein
VSGRITFRHVPECDNYIVYLGDDRIGWVRRVGLNWAATDTFMINAGFARTRADAAARLRRRFERAQKRDAAEGSDG